MEVAKETLYLKGDANVEVTSRAVTLGDIVQMECADPKVVKDLEKLTVFRFPKQDPEMHHGSSRAVISVLRIIACIHGRFPELEIQNLGETDLIVTFEDQRTAGRFVHWLKAALVVLISFAGSAFSIMAFNNDIDSNRLFGHIYEMVTGTSPQGYTILEVTYSIGIVIGILVFFNHFGRKNFSVDPTPMEVEMRLYETDIQRTLVENYTRRGKTIDVDTADTHGHHGT